MQLSRIPMIMTGTCIPSSLLSGNRFSTMSGAPVAMYQRLAADHEVTMVSWHSEGVITWKQWGGEGRQIAFIIIGTWKKTNHLPKKMHRNLSKTCYQTVQSEERLRGACYWKYIWCNPMTLALINKYEGTNRLWSWAWKRCGVKPMLYPTTAIHHTIDTRTGQ